ncbi:MAG: hypothetical protein WBP64_15185 [Nitrososphaeraceae archaeon]
MIRLSSKSKNVEGGPNYEDLIEHANTSGNLIIRMCEILCEIVEEN